MTLLFVTQTMLRGILFVFFLFSTSFLGCLFILFPFAPCMYFSPKIWRWACDKFVAFWILFPISLLQYMFRIKFKVSGHFIENSEPALLIMNHRTRLDWLFLWPVLYRMDPLLLTTSKISLKYPLKKIPGAGWAMECNQFIFLERNWQTDSIRLNDNLKYYASSNKAYQLLLFPEGTDMCKKARARNAEYSDKMSLHHTEYTLHPRVTGFAHALMNMRRENYMSYVYDITISYEDSIPQNEIDLLSRGLIPKTIHFHIRKIPNRCIPTEETEIADWLKGVWVEKEKVLKHFYETPQSSRDLTNSVATVLSEQIGDSDFLHRWPLHSPILHASCLAFGFSFWVFTSLTWTYFFYILPFMRLYVFVAITFFVVVQWKMNGVDGLVLQLWKQSLKKQT